MNGMADVAVGLWFVPVLVNIVLPLAMLAGWGAFRLLFRKTGRETSNQTASLGKAESFSQAQA